MRGHKQDLEDLSIIVVEPFGMVLTAWAFFGLAETRPQCEGENLLLIGDSMSATYWVNRCKWGTEPRSGALMSILGCLEMDAG